MSSLLDGSGVNCGDASTEARLSEWVSPSVFEHLVIALLQCESDGRERWHHVGGAGDGGVDGLAIDSSNAVVGALQCKWQYGGNVSSLAAEVATIRNTWPEARVVIAVLHNESGARGPAPSGNPAYEYWGRKEIAALLEKHAKRIPLAQTLGVPIA